MKQALIIAAAFTLAGVAGGCGGGGTSTGTGGMGGSPSSSSSSSTGTGGHGGGSGCAQATDCPGTDDACQARTCTAGQCGVSFTAAGMAVTAQTAGDCQVVQCDGNGAMVTVADDTDVPDDSNPCTDDLCENGVPSHASVAAGTSCGTNLACDGDGHCMGCTDATDCPGTDTECQTRTCTGGQCGFTFTAAGTALTAQTAGDCKRDQCDGNGNVVSVSDDTDVPVDNEACTKDICINGAPSNPPVAAGTVCNENGGTVCNAMGACVQCVTAATCPGSDTECKTRTCTAGVCGVSFTASGAAVANQTPGDCHKNQCDGNGNIVTAVDNTDLPNDNNPCTNDVCNSGVASHSNVAAGTSCGAGAAKCDGNGNCTSCVTAADCPGADTTCHTRTCTAGVCGFSNTADGTSCDDGNASTTGDVCTAGACAGVDHCLGVICAALDQCHTAGTCVDHATGACDSPAKADGSACNDGDACTQTDTCQAGACVGKSPITCAPLDQCHTAGTCDSTTGACSNPAKNDGTSCDDGNACTGNDVCTNGACAGALQPLGTACGGGKVCSAAGSCVECNVGSDCASGVCTSNVCHAPSCTDGVQNGTETGVDCGGTCPVCAVVTSTVPDSGATGVPFYSSVVINFSTAMDGTTLTSNTSSGACTGSVQVSTDGFATCIGIAAGSALSNGGKTLTLTPAPALSFGSDYKIRVTSAAKAMSGTALTAYTSSNPFTTTAPPPLCLSGGVVISQVYGGGGGTNPTYGNDFIELFNQGSVPVNLNGWAVQYASATSGSWSGKTVLPDIDIAPGGHILIQEGGGSSGTFLSLPTPDVTGTISMAAGAGKVALTKNSTALTGVCPTGGAIVDLVGYGSTASCYEGTGPTAAPSATTAITRGGAACQDTNNNTADFTTAAPNPRNSTVAASFCTCGDQTLNESNAVLEADYCVLQFPASLSVPTGTSTGLIYGRLFEMGVTEAAGASSWIAQVGYGPESVNPENQSGWQWFAATYNTGFVDPSNDEYQASFTAPAAGTYRYTFRFSSDGVRWTYCDVDGVGSNNGLTFETTKLPILTVTP